MEPLEILAGTTLALILVEASKEGGKSLGQSASKLVTQLRKSLWKRIIQRNKLPDSMEPEVLEGEILEVLKEDPDLAEQADLVVSTVNESDAIAKQVMVEYAQTKNIKLERVRQTRGSSQSPINQTLVSNVDVVGDISISDAIQEG